MGSRYTGGMSERFGTRMFGSAGRVAAACCVGVSAPAAAQDSNLVSHGASNAVSHRVDPFSGFVVHEDAGAAVSRISSSGTARFAERGYDAWSLSAGAAFNSEANDYQLVYGYHYFIADNFEFSVRGSGWVHDQEDSTPISANVGIAFRYYFLNEDRPTDDQWAWYLEAGIGLLGSSEEVPEDGSQFNFTPRAGGGVAIPLTDSGVRLDLGVRWHHISNASQFGTDDNPDRDSIMVYAGVMFPM